MLKIVEENCSTCGEGRPLSSGVYAAQSGDRVRWAMWTCGHMWKSSDAGHDKKLTRAGTMRRVLAATGIGRHAPIS
jgi:hypothetical protein